MKKICRILLAMIALTSMAATSYGTIVYTSQDSTVSANVRFGYVGSVNQTSTTRTETDFIANQLVIQGSDSGEGSVGDVSWVANYSYSVDQQLTTGPSGFEAAASTQLFTFQGGDGVSNIEAINSFVLEFTLDASQNFQLSANPTAGAKVLLEHWDGSNWREVVFLQGIVQSLRGIVPAGLYRFTGDAASISEGFASGEAWSFKAVFVPEPNCSFVIFGTSLLLAARIRNRSETRCQASPKHFTPAK